VGIGIFYHLGLFGMAHLQSVSIEIYI
jgi:hypothetical protein